MLLAACTPTTQPEPTTIAAARPIDGVVVSIIDGDTIRVITGGGEITVRLAAINTPDQGECQHEEARAWLDAMADGADVSLEVVGIDQFDRTLAHVFVDNNHINRELVSIGMAVVSNPNEDNPYRAALLEAEHDAFGSRRGLWASDACDSTGLLPDVVIDAEASVPDPPGPDDARLSDEYVTIVNRGGEIVDLGGWTLRDTSSRHRYTFPQSAFLGPGDEVQVNSEAAGWDPGDNPVWNNDGDMALLLDESGRVISRWRY